ncbi:hypothetical protein GXM_03605 [Nostoc sphaeroides CCNUC1]|uniref:Uncharacterized protein n=1 Tax=Nostoc sphaeroides CCNUC1 TaxID=2653204 RepID=A0A5P8W078_9NOSO|nr:hypothetical protein GXM_03605 [Nostoc sphaeroides CCNUC1]
MLPNASREGAVLVRSVFHTIEKRYISEMHECVGVARRRHRIWENLSLFFGI